LIEDCFGLKKLKLNVWLIVGEGRRAWRVEMSALILWKFGWAPSVNHEPMTTSWAKTSSGRAAPIHRAPIGSCTFLPVVSSGKTAGPFTSTSGS
jgi:hypothetical protein